MLDLILKYCALVGVAVVAFSRFHRIREIYVMYRNLYADLAQRLALLRFVTTRMLFAWDGTSQESRLLQTLEEVSKPEPLTGFPQPPATYRRMVLTWMTIGRFGSDFNTKDFLDTLNRLSGSGSRRRKGEE